MDSKQNLNTYIEKAKRLLAEKKYDEAIALYENLISLNPSAAWPYLKLADIYQQLFNNQKAEELSEKATEIEPENPWGFISLVKLLRQENRLELALKHCELGLEFNPENEKLQLLLSEITSLLSEENPTENWLEYAVLAKEKAEQGKNDEAIALYEQAISLNPDEAWPYVKLADLYEKNYNYTKAISLLEKATEIEPENPWGFITLVKLLRQENRLELALKKCELGLEFNPENEKLQLLLSEITSLLPEENPTENWLEYALLAKEKAEQGKNDKAIALYEQAISLNPDEAWPYVKLAELNEKLFNNEKALKLYEKGTEIEPENPWGFIGLIQILRQENKLEEALHKCELGLEFNPENKKLQALKQSIEGANDPVRLIAFFLPQYHPIPENNEWWGKGFTEWTNVTKAKPLFEGHYQPKLPADLGFYDLRLPEVRDAQAKLAKKYGIYGFCYYYYWFAGKRLLDRPVDEILESKHPDFPFCLCWANENWSRRWDGSENDILIAQEHSFENNKAFAESLVPFMKDERYIRVNGKPLVLVYRVSILPDIEETVKLWRDVWRENGIGEVYLCGCLSFGIQTSQLIKWGFDAGVQFPPHGVPADSIDPASLEAPDYKGHIYDFTSVVKHSLRAKMPSLSEKEFLSVMTAWDNTARKGKSGNAFIYANPELYELWLCGAIEKIKQSYTGDERLVFINAWNEWAEGTYLEPDRKYGHDYLQATSKALNETYSLQTCLGLLSHLPIETREHKNHLINQLQLRINNLEQSVDLILRETKIARQKYIFFEDIKFVAWHDTPTYLESPSQGKKYHLSDDITFAGWSFNKKGQPVKELQIVDNKKAKVIIPVNNERSDVYNSHSECQQLNTGLSTQIKAKNLFKDQESYELDIYATLEDNQSIKVVTINLKIIEEEKKISGKLKTKIKWYYIYKETLSKLLDQLKEFPSTSPEFQHLVDEAEEIINNYLSLLENLKVFILSEKNKN